MKTKREADAAIKALRPFINPSQLRTMRDLCRGEEKQFFIDKLCEYAERIAAMPKTGETEGQGDQAVVHLHYFTGAFDWWITEKDMEAPGYPGQHQAFGLADMGDPELGYISIVELLANNLELDLHFTPVPLAQVRTANLVWHTRIQETVDDTKTLRRLWCAKMLLKPSG